MDMDMENFVSVMFSVLLILLGISLPFGVGFYIHYWVGDANPVYGFMITAIVLFVSVLIYGECSKYGSPEMVMENFVRGVLGLGISIGFPIGLGIITEWMGGIFGYGAVIGMLIEFIFLLVINQNREGRKVSIPHSSATGFRPSFSATDFYGRATNENSTQLYVDTGYDGATYSVVSTKRDNDTYVNILRFDENNNAEVIKTVVGGQFDIISRKLREYVSEDGYKWAKDRSSI